MNKPRNSQIFRSKCAILISAVVLMALFILRVVFSVPGNPIPLAFQINYDSTDQLNGFPCWQDGALTTYLSRKDVKQAIHVAENLMDLEWADCNNNISYHRIYYEMGPFFDYILKNSNVRILIYNGDVDMVCNFLGDQWFIEQVAANNSLKVKNARQPWWYRGEIAGYVKTFDRIDQATVKGAGHFVPTSRAGPSLQMITNFIFNSDDYSKPIPDTSNTGTTISSSTPTEASTTSVAPHRLATDYRLSLFCLLAFMTFRYLV